MGKKYLQFSVAWHDEFDKSNNLFYLGNTLKINFKCTDKSNVRTDILIERVA